MSSQVIRTPQSSMMVSGRTCVVAWTVVGVPWRFVRARVISTRVLLSSRSRARMQSPEARVCIRAKMLAEPHTSGSRFPHSTMRRVTSALLSPPTHHTVFGVDVLSHSHSHPHPHSRTSPACLSTQQPAHTSTHTHTHTCTRAHNHTARTPCTSSRLTALQTTCCRHNCLTFNTPLATLLHSHPLFLARLSQPLHELFVTARLCAHSHHRVPCPLRCGPDKTTIV
jgi:hypothetical protein